MNDRARLAIGGGAVGLASLAVVMSVVVSNALTLTDVAGAPSGEAGVVVSAGSASPLPTGTPDPGTTPSATPSADPAPSGDEPGAVTVPAPDPVVVSGPADSVATTAEDDAWIVASTQAGSWEAARAWAAERGWNAAKIDAWIARLEVKLQGLVQSGAVTMPGNASWNRPSDSPSDRSTGDIDEWPGRSSKNSPQTPANAGTPAAPASENGGGSMKGQSRESPDDRD